jgi:2'-5' RNA ligase
LFIAVFPPPEVQNAVYAIAESLRRPGDGVSWVKPDNLHYTLRFLGELGEDGARRAVEAAREAAGPRQAFEASMGALGAFPNSRRASVLWISLSDGSEAMVDLAHALEEGLRRRGFDRADRPFSSHLTLGRVRIRNRDWTALLAEAKLPQPAPRFRVDRISVVVSKLDPKGSIYRVRDEALLRPA